MEKKKLTVSIVVPARDEAGTITRIPKLIPEMGRGVEIIFVEGYSTDGTWEEIKKIESQRPEIKIRAYQQGAKKGKAGAVQVGFGHAKGDILMILDADLSVAPEELPKFYELLASGTADFANGSRFIYPKEKGAMPQLNQWVNKFFALTFSIILRQRITDTLCGTKALRKGDYERILAATKDIRKDDQHGDFTLLMGAVRLGLKIVEVPVHYKSRVYGGSKISSFGNGVRLILLLGKYIKNSLF